VYTPSGEYWKTLFNDVALAEAPDGSRHLIGASLVAVDDRADHATYTPAAASDRIFEFNSARLEPDLFTVGGLLRRAK
jgi:hypothetical protein